MQDLKTLIEDIKEPRYLAIFIVINIFCMALGYMRGSIGGLVVGIVIGIALSFAGLILIHKHSEKQEAMREAVIIPKIGLTEKKEQWLRKKKLQELRAEYRIDMMIKFIWWIIFVIIALNILYWISPIIYYTLQVANM